MTQIVLTDNLKQTALQQYHPYINIELWSLEQNEYDNGDDSKDIILQNITNLKILNNDIEKMLLEDNEASLQEYQKYVSSDYANIIFTPFDDITNTPINDIIIKYEYYNGVFYLELPRFYRTICLHLLPNYYYANDDVVLLNTEDIIEYVNEHPTTWTTIDATREDDKINIIGEGIGRYLIPLPQYLRKMSSIEIDVFYKYLEDTVNYENKIGIIDTYNRGYQGLDAIEKEYEDQKTLINSSIDETNIVTIAKRQQNDIQIDNAFKYCLQPNSSFEINSIESNKYYETIIKYSNDNIYIEQYNQRADSDVVDRISELSTNSDTVNNYIFSEWEEDLEESECENEVLI